MTRPVDAARRRGRAGPHRPLVHLACPDHGPVYRGREALSPGLPAQRLVLGHDRDAIGLSVQDRRSLCAEHLTPYDPNKG